MMHVPVSVSVCQSEEDMPTDRSRRFVENHDSRRFVENRDSNLVNGTYITQRLFAIV